MKQKSWIHLTLLVLLLSVPYGMYCGAENHADAVVILLIGIMSTCMLIIMKRG